MPCAGHAVEMTTKEQDCFNITCTIFLDLRSRNLLQKSDNSWLHVCYVIIVWESWKSVKNALFPERKENQCTKSVIFFSVFFPGKMFLRMCSWRRLSLIQNRPEERDRFFISIVVVVVVLNQLPINLRLFLKAREKGRTIMWLGLLVEFFSVLSVIVLGWSFFFFKDV